MTTMIRRIEAARICQAGASNERKVAQVLVDAIDECRAEGVDPRTDDAVFLILHQLAFLLDGIDIGSIRRWERACKKVGL